jgi:predicted transposase YbfD/YdcC
MAFSFPGKLLVTTQVILREKAIRVSFCHHACCSSIRGARATQGKQGDEFRDADISELMEMLAEIPEFRGAKGREYALSFLLAVCVVATLAGAKNYREIATVAAGISQRQLRLLGAEWDYFGNCYRYPRRTVIWTVLTNVDAVKLDRITGTWLLARARKYKDEDGGIKWVIAIDGKVMRGSWTDENDKVTLFSAMLQEESLTVAQVRVPDGTNEITQVKALAEELGIQDGETVLATFDAAHCNKKTAMLIGGKQGWDYLITVKTDKPALYRKAAGKIQPLLGRDPDDVMIDRSHGVIKTWSCWITEAGNIEFPHISQVACICREVRSLTGEKMSKEVAIQVTSATREEMRAADMNRHTRRHWGIENKSHYTRDTVYREDHNQSWKGTGPHALASLRNFATGLFRMKGIKSIKEATEMVHMDRMLAFHYMATMRDDRCAALPANGPAYTVPGLSASGLAW